MRHPFRLAALALLVLPAWAESIDCNSPAPSRAASAYWDYLSVCGCTRAEPVSQGSLEYDKWLRICAPSLQEQQRARVLAEELKKAESTTTESKPESAKPEPAKPAPSTSEWSKPEPAKPEPAKPKSANAPEKKKDGARPERE
jgi:hypothetical protein